MERSAAALGDPTPIARVEAAVYLAYAAVSPVTLGVRAAVDAVLNDFARHGRGAVLNWVRQRERLREKFAAFLGTQAANLAFSTGTTRGILDLALSIPWRSGDRIVLFDGEFPANVVPWQSVSGLFDLRVERLPRPDPRRGEDALLGPLETALKAGARLVALSAVQFQSGLRAPLERVSALCHHYGAELAVDAIQACGVVPIDVAATKVDYLVTGAHKWLMGMEGAAVIYAEPSSARALVPRTAGWLSLHDGTRFLFEGPGELDYDRPVMEQLRYLEAGSAGSVSFAALEAALDPIVELTPERILEHVTSYLAPLETALMERGFQSQRASDPALCSGILSVLPPAGFTAAALCHGLERRGVIASNPDGLLRFAPHYPNAPSELPIVLGALDECLAELGALASPER